jgi:hypothetical protein
MRLIGSISILLAGAAACGQADISGGYVARRPGYLAYLRLTQSGNTVSGYLQQAVSDLSSPLGLRVIRDDVSGRASRQNVTLKVGGFLGHGKRELTGTTARNTLFLTYPTDSGFIHQLTFSRTSPAEWNRELASFRGRQWEAASVAARDRARQQEEGATEERAVSLAREFERGAHAIEEAQTAFLAQRQLLPNARESVIAAEAVHKTATQRLTGLRAHLERLRREDAALQPRRTFEQNEQAFRAIEERFRQLDAEAIERDRLLTLVDKARAILEDMTQNCNLAWDALQRATRDVAGARSELERIGRGVLLTGIPVGAMARSRIGPVDVFIRPSADASVLQQLAAGSRFRVLTERNGWYSLASGEKEIGWIKAADCRLEVPGRLGPPPGSPSEPRATNRPGASERSLGQQRQRPPQVRSSPRRNSARGPRASSGASSPRRR